MSLTALQIFVEDLRPGMFVSSLDWPWQEIPFPIQGFLIRTSADRERLKAFCSYAFVDARKRRDISIPDRLVGNESVKTRSCAQQIQQLPGLGCDILQGYFLSRPLPQDQFITWIKSREAADNGPEQGAAE